MRILGLCAYKCCRSGPAFPCWFPYSGCDEKSQDSCLSVIRGVHDFRGGVPCAESYHLWFFDVNSRTWCCCTAGKCILYFGDVGGWCDEHSHHLHKGLLLPWCADFRSVCLWNSAQVCEWVDLSTTWIAAYLVDTPGGRNFWLEWDGICAHLFVLMMWPDHIALDSSLKTLAETVYP